MQRLLLALVLLAATCSGSPAAEKAAHRLETDISYVPQGQAETSDYQLERCKLDVYYPDSVKGFATVVWFHGGG
ncbi:MAG: alpha/beta hydrolase, partial [Thermoguttaceae bacterium]